MNKQEVFQSYLENWKNCQRCNLCKPTRKGISLGLGPTNSKIAFVVEWPKDQMAEQQGYPFTDMEADLFQKGLEFFGASMSDVFVVPILGCRPSDDMGTTIKPQAAQLKVCQERVDRTIEIIDPLVVVLIGQKAFNAYGKHEYKKFTYSNLCSDPRPIEAVFRGESGAEIRRSAIVLRPFDWIMEKDPDMKKNGPIQKMLEALQIAFAILDNHTEMLYGWERPARKEVIDL